MRLHSEKFKDIEVLNQNSYKTQVWWRRKCMKQYIAYGSNLNVTQMSMRCPTAKLIGKGVVKDYELLFRGNKKNAVATIEPKEGGIVPVAIWEIGQRDEARLDRYEGYPHLYGKQHMFVKMDNGFETKAMVYIMDDRYPLNIPSKSYLSTIEQGYEDVGLNKQILHKAVDNAMKYKEIEHVQMAQML